MSKKIIRFQANDVLRLQAVEIEPSGHIVTLGGRNRQGKSSTLNAIMLALGGRKAAGRGKLTRPIRDGAERGDVVLDLGEYIVERTFTPSGDKVVVKTHDGAEYRKPQELLDKLFNAVSFEPMAFVAAKSDDQTDMLQKLMKLDLSDLDSQHAALYQERTDINKQVKAQEIRVADMPRFPEAPEAEVSTAELVAELDRRQATIREHQKTRAALVQVERDLEANRSAITQQEAAVEALRAQLKQAEELLDVLRTTARECEEERARQAFAVAALVDPDLAEVKAQITASGAVNQQVAANRARGSQVVELERLRTKSRELTEQLDAIAAQRTERIAAAKFPVPGLGFDEHGVTMNGLPFDQASGAEQIAVSVAVGIAANSDLRVFLVRDASKLDQDSLALLGRLAESHDCQVWLEDNRTTDPAAIIIEDGRVLVASPALPEAANG